MNVRHGGGCAAFDWLRASTKFVDALPQPHVRAGASAVRQRRRLFAIFNFVVLLHRYCVYIVRKSHVVAGQILMDDNSGLDLDAAGAGQTALAIRRRQTCAQRNLVNKTAGVIMSNMAILGRTGRAACRSPGCGQFRLTFRRGGSEAGVRSGRANGQRQGGRFYRQQCRGIPGHSVCGTTGGRPALGAAAGTPRMERHPRGNQLWRHLRAGHNAWRLCRACQ